jgi:hypothetical protein
MILHQLIEEDLVLVSQRGEESVFKDHGRLLTSSIYAATISGVMTHLLELIKSPSSLLLQTMHIVGQETLEIEDLSLLACKTSTLVKAGVVQQSRSYRLID